MLLVGLSTTTYAACPTQGDAADSLSIRLNRLKNRMTPPRRFMRGSSLQAVLAPGNDYLLWSEDDGVLLEGYVVGVRTGPVESCNCHATADSARDTHIELAVERGEVRGWRILIAEVTPMWRKRMRAEGTDWSTDGLRARYLGRKVRIGGWMLFDLEHSGDSRNTAPRGRGNARATAWEIHPVTSLGFAE